MPRQIPKVDDVFAVPLDDGSCTLGQVIETDPILMNSITCVFYDARGYEVKNDKVASLDDFNPIACQFVTRDQFNKGKWHRVGHLKSNFPPEQYPYRETRKNGCYWLQQFTGNLNERLVLMRANVEGGTIRRIICAAIARHK